MRKQRSTPTILSARSAASKRVLLPLWIFHVPITISLLVGSDSVGFIVVGKSRSSVGTVCSVVVLIESPSSVVLLLLSLLILLNDSDTSSGISSTPSDIPGSGNSRSPPVEFNVTTGSLTRSFLRRCDPLPLREPLIIELLAAALLLRLVLLISLLPPALRLPLILIFLKSVAILLPRPELRELFLVLDGPPA